jgi:hypothetical protein
MDEVFAVLLGLSKRKQVEYLEIGEDYLLPKP